MPSFQLDLTEEFLAKQASELEQAFLDGEETPSRAKPKQPLNVEELEKVYDSEISSLGSI